MKPTKNNRVFKKKSQYKKKSQCKKKSQNTNNSKYTKKARKQNNKKYGSGQFKRVPESERFNAKEAMRPIVEDDFKEGGIMHINTLLQDVIVLDKDKDKTATTLFLRIVDPKQQAIDFLNTLSEKVQISSCINETKEGANNIVCPVHGDFYTENPTLSLRVSIDKYSASILEISYLEELKILSQLSKHEITPEIYFGGLCVTTTEDTENKRSLAPEYHFYSIMERFHSELFDIFEYVYQYYKENRPLYDKCIKYIHKHVSLLIENFAVYSGMNCDCRSTNMVVNALEKKDTLDIPIEITKIRMIDIDKTYYMSNDELLELFQKCEYMHKFFTGSIVTREQVIQISKDAMNYIFWLEIGSSGLHVDRYILEYLNRGNNKLFFLFLFLKTKPFFRPIYNILNKPKHNINIHFLFTFPDYIMYIIKMYNSRNFTYSDDINTKMMIEDVDRKLERERQIKLERERERESAHHSKRERESAQHSKRERILESASIKEETQKKKQLLRSDSV